MTRAEDAVTYDFRCGACQRVTSTSSEEQHLFNVTTHRAAHQVLETIPTGALRMELYALLRGELEEPPF